VSVTGRPSGAALAGLASRIEAAATPGRRFVVGIAGSPGSGKTTLALSLVGHLNARRTGIAAHLPMDGFHLANDALERRGLRERKGAIETFDGWGFLAMLGRLREETDHTIFAPSFRREVDEGIAGEIAIEPDVEIVVVEGNYLLVDRPPWAGVRPLLDVAWFCRTPPADREARLIDRHMRHGRTREAATTFAREVDGANALLIEASASTADLVVSGVTGEPEAVVSER
jgi:pantothenate kinase